MTVALSASIAVAIAKAGLRLTFTATAGNFVRIWCTAAPAGSTLRGKLDKNKSTRAHLQDADSGKAFDYTFDVAGAYQLAATEITKGAAPYGGGYQGAPDANRAEAAIGETALTFYVASALKAPVGQSPDTGELILHVANDLIRETTIAVHGIATPAIAKPRTDKAATAAEGSALAAALAALIGTSATVAIGDLSAVTTNAIDRFNAHIVSATYHSVSDSENSVSSSFRNPTSPDALKRSLAALLKALGAHIRNDSTTTPVGTGSSAWHGSAVDWAAIPLFESSSTVADHVRALSDAWRAFEAHRGSAVHLTPDPNALAALPPLLNVHRLFLQELASLNPTSPVTENPAKTILVHGAGFEEI